MSAAELQQWLRLAATPLLGPLCALWPAFRDRVLGNPRFLLVLAVEEVIGCTAKTIAEYRVRKQDFWKVCLASLPCLLTSLRFIRLQPLDFRQHLKS